MLDQVFNDISTLDFEEFGAISISQAKWHNHNLVLALGIATGREEILEYEVTCERPRAYRIDTLRCFSNLHVDEEHVLLWPHTQKYGELYFVGKASNPYALLGELYEVHHELVSNWFELTRFVNLPYRAADIFRSGFGLLARGPVPLLTAYASVLEHHGVRQSFLGSRDPLWWDGSKWVPDGKLYVLRFGDSFVVSPAFNERKG